MRSYMRDINLGRETQPHIPHAVGMTEEEMYEMYRLLAIAKYEERYVIPTVFSPQARDLEEMGCSLSGEGGPGMYESGPFGEGSGAPVPVAVETFHALKQRQHGEATENPARRDLHERDHRRSRVNLLNWDGNGAPAGLFPESDSVQR
jgi:nitrate reductase beta subunit